MKPANELLREWRKSNRLTKNKARLLMKNPPSSASICCWERGIYAPCEAFRIDIEVATGGYVPASAWPVLTKYAHKNTPYESAQPKTVFIAKEMCFKGQDIDPRMIPKNGFMPTAVYAEQQYNGGSSNMLLDAI